MLSYKKLQEIANIRLKDARILCDGGQFDGAVYICGYANECALKAVICKKLNLHGIPNTKDEFEIIPKNIQDIRTHDLEKLLGLLNSLKSGKKIVEELHINHLSDWNRVLDWSPEQRYLPPIANKTEEKLKEEAGVLIESTTKILRYFWEKL